VTSIEVPYSIAAALPTLAVIDITNEVSREIGVRGVSHGIAYVTATHDASAVRVNEREAGFFSDVEELLTRIVPLDAKDRERLLRLLLGPRTEQVPFQDGALCLGTWQRVLLIGLDGAAGLDWQLTVIG
jgi:secondary thiamine-phosphate synthase enzyme